MKKIVFVILILSICAILPFGKSVQAGEYQTTAIYMINIPTEKPWQADVLMLDALNWQNSVTILPKGCNFVQLNYIWSNPENKSQYLVLQLMVPATDWKSMKVDLKKFVVTGYKPIVEYLKKKGE